LEGKKFKVGVSLSEELEKEFKEILLKNMNAFMVDSLHARIRS